MESAVESTEFLPLSRFPSVVVPLLCSKRRLYYYFTSHFGIFKFAIQDFGEEDVFVCESKYNIKRKSFKKIKVCFFSNFQ